MVLWHWFSISMEHDCSQQKRTTRTYTLITIGTKKMFKLTIFLQKYLHVLSTCIPIVIMVTIVPSQSPTNIHTLYSRCYVLRRGDLGLVYISCWTQSSQSSDLEYIHSLICFSWSYHPGSEERKPSRHVPSIRDFLSSRRLECNTALVAPKAEDTLRIFKDLALFLPFFWLESNDSCCATKQAGCLSVGTWMSSVLKLAVFYL